MKTFSPILDVESENIIYLLSQDSRQTITHLAKKLNRSRKVIENRYGNLFKKGYLKYLLVTNEDKRIRFTALIKLSKFEGETIQKIREIGGLIKLKETLGPYDLSLLFDVYSREKADEIIAKISKLVHNNIVTFDVLFHDFEDTLGYKSFCHNFSLLKYAKLKPKAYTLSDSENNILNILKNEPNISFSKLSGLTKIPYSRLKEVIDGLIKNEIIRFSVDPDYNKLKLEFHNSLIKIDLGQRKNFEEYIIKHPRVHWLKTSSGKWDYVLSIAATNINEFIDIIRQIRSDNKNAILEETSLVSKIQETRKY